MPKTRAHTGTSKTAAGSEPEIVLHGIWSGTISFSLVAIPVELVKAVEPGRITFRTLHRQDYAPLARRMFCPREGAVVPPDEIIRGYEIGPDKYLLVTDEELESLSPERSRTIEIIEFIELQEVDPIYYDHPYYLIPSKGGEKSYRLLAEVMARTNKAGLARFVLHEREYFVAVQSTGGALILFTLHYPEEILADQDMAPPAGLAAAAEKDRLKNVIENMLADFDPQHYADGRRQKILDLLRQKAKDQALVEAPAAAREEGEGPADLMTALEESMRQIKKQP